MQASLAVVVESLNMGVRGNPKMSCTEPSYLQVPRESNCPTGILDTQMPTPLSLAGVDSSARSPATARHHVEEIIFALEIYASSQKLIAP